MFIFIGYIWNEDYIIILLEVFVYKIMYMIGFLL